MTHLKHAVLTFFNSEGLFDSEAFFFNSEESEHYSKTLLILVQKLVQHECKPKQYSEYSMPRLTYLLQEIIGGQRPSIEGQSQFVIN